MQSKQIQQLRNDASAQVAGTIEFTGKAERRGVQRAAIEIALNLLATNQEQHRPDDRFRIVEIPPPYQPQQSTTALSLPLEPWNRPIEQDPFKYSRRLTEYRQWKDSDYNLGRSQVINQNPVRLAPPLNYNGPFVAATGDDITEAVRRRQILLNNY